ncbi:MAG: PAS domain S-box protein [candidate division Zixibacteria bacterium]|nr:PAS domain S-box protein [candidate division Zixibacteria bacterium]
MFCANKIHKIIENNFIWVGVLISGLFWFLDSIIQALVFGNGTIIEQILSPSSQEIWIRILVFFILISTSSLVQSYVFKRKKAEKDVLNSGYKYQNLFDSANDAIFLMEKDLFVDCNTKTLELFGCTRDQIIGQPPYKFSPEYQTDGQLSRKSALEKINAALEGYPQCFEWKHCQYDGTLFDAEVNLNRMDSLGKIYIQAIVRDITDRKQAEYVIKQSEEQYRSLFENAYYAISLFNTNNVITMINNVGAKTLGKSPNELIGKTLKDIFPAHAEIMIDRNQQALKTGLKYEFDDRILMPDGSEKWFWSNLQPIKDTDGKITSILIISHDMTDKKNAEEALAKSQSLLKAILESTGDGILVVNNKGEVTHTNAGFAELWKIPSHLLQTHDDEKLIEFVLQQLDDPEAFLAKVKILYNSSEKDTDILNFKDGRVFERHSYPLIQNNEIAGRVWNFRDINENNKKDNSSQSQQSMKTI